MVHRPEKGWRVDRRSKLWPETVAAVQVYLDHRTSDELPKLVYVTRFGRQWSRHALSREFTKVSYKADVGLGSPEWFRKTCQAIGEGASGFVALRRIMGHPVDSISDHYREGIDDSRLVEVSDYLYTWLYGIRRKSRKS